MIGDFKGKERFKYADNIKNEFCYMDEINKKVVRSNLKQENI